MGPNSALGSSCMLMLHGVALLLKDQVHGLRVLLDPALLLERYCRLRLWPGRSAWIRKTMIITHALKLHQVLIIVMCCSWGCHWKQHGIYNSSKKWQHVCWWKPGYLPPSRSHIKGVTLAPYILLCPIQGTGFYYLYVSVNFLEVAY